MQQHEIEALVRILGEEIIAMHDRCVLTHILHPARGNACNKSHVLQVVFTRQYNARIIIPDFRRKCYIVNANCLLLFGRTIDFYIIHIHSIFRLTKLKIVI